MQRGLLLAIICCGAWGLPVATAQDTPPEEEDRAAVAEAERAIGRSTSDGDLQHLLLNSNNKYIRGTAARWLGERHISVARPALLQAIDDPERYVQRHAAIAYARVSPCTLDEDIVALFASPRSSTRLAAIGSSLEILDRCEETSLPTGSQLVQNVRSLLQDSSGDVRRDALVLLRRLPADFVAGRGTPLLLSCVDDPDPKVRAEAIRALNGESSREVVDALIARLQDPEPLVVHSAVRALAASGDPRAGQAVRRQLAHRNPAFRIAAIRALVTMGDAAGASDLWLLLSDRDPTVRVEAIEAVGKLKPPGAAAHLIPALEDREAEVRLATAATLRELCPRNDPPSARALAAATADPNLQVAREAIYALRCIRSQDNVEALMHAYCRCPNIGLRKDIHRLLEGATDVYGSKSCAEWRRWWLQHQAEAAAAAAELAALEDGGEDRGEDAD